MISEAGSEGGGKSLLDPRHSRVESGKLRDVEDAPPGSRTRHRMIIMAVKSSTTTREVPSNVPR